jgi:integrase
VTFDPVACTLDFTQKKTGIAMKLPVVPELAEILTGESGESLLLTPRGKPWKVINAQETLRTLLTNLGLPRYTLHGLRSTAVTELARLGFSELAIMAVTGHTDARAIRPYLRGFDQARTAHPAMMALADRLIPALREARIGANTNTYAGATGKAAAALKIKGRARDRRKPLRKEAVA